MKLYAVSIQMKASEQYFPVVLFVFCYFSNWNQTYFFKFLTWTNLSSLGGEGVKHWQMQLDCNLRVFPISWSDDAY